MAEHRSRVTGPQSSALLQKMPTVVGSTVASDNHEMEEIRSRLAELEASKHQKVLSPTERRHRRRWYPVIAVVVLLNFLLWFSMLFAIFEARSWHYNKASYLTSSWMIVIVPSVVLLVVLISPLPKTLGDRRKTIILKEPSRRNISMLNILNAIACFSLVTAYLYLSGIPQYNHPTWGTDLDFSLNLHVPAMTLLIPNADSGISLRTPNNPRESIRARAVFNSTAQNYSGSAIGIHQGFHDLYTAVVFNTSRLDITDFTTIQDTLSVELDVNYNSSAAANLDITTYFEVFDPRLSLATVYDCEIANYPRMPAFASNTFTIVAEHIIDQYGLVISPSATNECGTEYHKLLKEYSTPYTAYSWNLESSIPTVANIADCDVAENPDASCKMAISVSFGTHLVHTSTSQPGISKLNIWLNAGSITGAVQFFAWFLEMLIS